jgi:hypothetical protein
LCLGLGVASPALAQSPAFSGDAQVLKADVDLLGMPALNADVSKVGPLPASGGTLSESLLTVGPLGILGVSVEGEVAHAITDGSGYDAESEASVAMVGVDVPGLSIDAGVLQARSKAVCNPDGTASVSGSSYIAALKINGQDVIVGTGPNQSIVVPGIASITLNEQSTSPGSITVTALHVILFGDPPLNSLASGDIAISQAHSDVSNCPPPPPPPPPGCGKKHQPPCPPPPPPPPCTGKDWITGGGWVTDADGDKITFSVHGGINKDGSFRNGHLNVIDHGDGSKRSSKVLKAYRITGATTRELDFDMGSGIIGTVKVADNGEPPTADTFQFSSGGYTASGAPISGGNIQLHQPRGCQDGTSGGGGGGKGGGKPR